jgi:hypothetical protein
MGSTILTVIVLVVMWVVVLVPMFARRNEEAEEAAAGLGGAVRMLARGGSASRSEDDEEDVPDAAMDAAWADETSEVDSASEIDPPESAEDERDGYVVDARAETNERVGMGERSDAGRRPMSASRAQMLARRRRTLGTIIMLAIITALLALGWRPRLWIVQVGLDVLLVGYLRWLRQEVRRERARRARRAQRAARGEGVARIEVTGRDRRPSSNPDGPSRPVRRPAAEPPDQVMTDEVVAAEEAEQPAEEVVDDGRWEPRPVPTPTYVNAAIHERRPSVREEHYHGVVELDDDDPEFSAEFEEDDYPTLEILPPPKAVNG